MSDDKQGSGDGSLEMTPSWGDAPGGESKPKQVAVRKKGDVAEAMQPTAADQAYNEEIAAASKKVAKERKLGFALMLTAIVVFVGLVAWKVTKVEVSITAEADSNYKSKTAQISVKVKSSHDVEVGVDGHGDKETVSPGESELKFDLKLDDLKLGANNLNVQVLKGGAVVKAAEVTVYRDFTLSIDKGKLADKPHNLYLNFTMPAGWKASLDKQEYEPSDGGKVAVPLSLQKVFDALDRFQEPQYRVEAAVKIIRDTGDEFLHIEKVDVVLPQARLELGIAKDAIVVGGKAAKIRGKVDPGSRVLVDGAAATVEEDGAFAASVKLPKAKGFKLKHKDLAGAITDVRSAVEAGKGKAIKIVVKTPGRVPFSREILAVRSKKMAKKFAKLAKAAK